MDAAVRTRVREGRIWFLLSLLLDYCAHTPLLKHQFTSMDTAAWRGAGRRGTHCQFTTWILQRDVEQGEAGHSLSVHHMDTAAWRGAGRGGALTASSPAWILQRDLEQGEAGHSLPVHQHGYCSVPCCRERRDTHYQFTTWILQPPVEQGEAGHSLPVHHMDTAAWRGAGRGGALTTSSPHGYCSVPWSRERRGTHYQFTTWILQRDVEQGEAVHSLPVHHMDTAAWRGAGRGGALTTSSPHGYCSVTWSRERRCTHYQFTTWILQRDVEQGEAVHSLPVHHMDTAAWRGAGRGGALTTSSPHGYCSVTWSRERRGTHYQFTTWILQRDVEQGEAGHSLPVHHMDTAASRGAGRRDTHCQFTTWIVQRDVEQGEAGHSLPVHHMDTAASRGAGRRDTHCQFTTWILQRDVEQGEAGHSLPVHHMDTAAWRGAGRGGALTTSSPHGYCSVTWSRERRGTHYQFTTWILQRPVEQGDGTLTVSSPHGYCSVTWSRERRDTHYQFTTWILQRDVEQGEAGHSLPVHHVNTAAWRGAGRGGALTTSSPHGYCSVTWSRETGHSLPVHHMDTAAWRGAGRRGTHYQFTTWIQQRDVEQGDGALTASSPHGYCSVTWSRETGHSLPVHHMDTAAWRGAGRRDTHYQFTTWIQQRDVEQGDGALTASSPHGYCSVTWSRERRGTHYQFTTWILQRDVEQGEAGHSLPVHHMDTAAWRGAGRGGALTTSSPHGYCSVTWSRRDGALTTSSPHGYCSVPWSRERRGTHYQFTTWILQRDVEQGEAGHSLPVHHMDTAAWRGAGRDGALTTSSPHGYCSVTWSRERRGTHCQFTTWILQRDVEQGETGHSLPVHHMDTAAWCGAGRGGTLTTSSPHGYCSVTWSRERRGTHYQFTTWILQRDVEQGEAGHSLPVHHMDAAAWRGAGRGGALTASSPHGYCSVTWSRERRGTHYQFTTWILQRDVEQGEAGHSLPVHLMDTAASRGAGRDGALTTSSQDRWSVQQDREVQEGCLQYSYGLLSWCKR